VAAAANVIPVPEDVDPMAASALVIAQVGYNTAQRFPESCGRTATVIGDGLIGQFTAQALVARGLRVLLSGHHDYRLERARVACPALCTANSAAAEFEKRFKDFAGDRVDVAVDSVGVPGTMAECFRRVKPFGHIAISGYMGGNQTMDVHRAFAGEYTVHFPAGATRDRLLATLELIRKGMIRVAPLVTHRLPGSDFAEACRLLGGKGAEYLGIALAW
jgi:threonine dehydrogenase-like Zn-dependent dehydrogenase